MANALIIFIKNPVAGRVKTRLAAEVGPQRALQIYHSLLAHTRRVASAVPATRRLYYSDHIDHQDEWPSHSFDKFLQSGPDLGARMGHAFAQTLALHPHALIIGSDCPGITPELLTQAFELLQSHDLVLGPATDGGYYLLGMNQPHPELFTHIAWSTAEVLPQTLARSQALGLSLASLPTLSDVDHLADWQAYGLSEEEEEAG